MQMDATENARITLEKHMHLGAKRSELTRDYIILEGRGAEEPRLKKKALSWKKIEHGGTKRDGLHNILYF